MENLNSSVRVVEVCRVAPQPSSPDSPLPDHYSLSPTFFDLVWLRFPTVQRLFIYETCSTESVLATLKTSLSLTLQHFLPVAGNLIWPQDSIKPILRYVKGDTVSVTIAESEAADFHRRLSSGEFLDVKEYHALVPQLEASHHRAAAMGLQITIFPNRGFSVGTVTNHVVMDGKTLVSFVKSWAHICKQIGFGGVNITTISLPDQLKPLYDRDDVISDQAGLGESYSKHFLDVHGPNNRDVMPAQSFTPISDPKLLEATADQIIRCTFEFTGAKIQVLRERVMKTTTISSGKSTHLSTFSLAVAYSWVCLVKAEEIKGGGKTGFVLPVDARTRLEPPVPATYFGNCVTCRVAEAETNDLMGDDGLAVAVSAISQAIKSLEQGVLNGAEYWVSNFIDFRVYDRIYSVAGSQRFEVYEIDFGWGRPKKTSVVSIDRTGAISVSDSKNGGGAIEVGVVLKKPQMEVFATFIC